MNSLMYYYNNVQKMAAYRQAKRMQRGVISGFRQPIVNASSTKFTMPPINIGTSDFSFEYFGNSSNILAQATAIYFIYNADPIITFVGINGGNGLAHFSILGKTTLLNWEARSLDELFHIVLSREGKSISLFINGQKLSGFEASEVADFGDISFMFSNASNLGLIRMWNYALSADEIATLYNNGDPMGYVVPKAKRDGLLAEYLPQNLMYGRDDKTIATSWLDSAKQLPLSDEYMEPLFQSIGGYDIAANGAPEILYNE